MKATSYLLVAIADELIAMLVEFSFRSLKFQSKYTRIYTHAREFSQTETMKQRSYNQRRRAEYCEGENM